MVACRLQLLLSLLPSSTALVALYSAHAARPSHALAMSEAAEIVTFVFDDEGNARELDERKNELAGLVVPTTIADPVKLLSTGSKVKKALVTAIPVEDATAAANNLAAAAKTLAAAAATAIQRFVVYVRTLEVAAVVGLVGLLPKTVSKDRALATLNSAKSLGLEYANVAADALSATRMRSVEVTALIVLLTKTTLLYNVECALMIFQKLAALGLKTADATTLAANTVKVFQNDLRPIVAVNAANAASTAASMADKLRLNEAANKLLLTGATTANKLKLMQAQVSLRTIARVDLDEAAVGLAAKAVETTKETVTDWKDAFQVLCDRRRAETWSPENAPTEAETWAAEVTRMHDGAAALRQSAVMSAWRRTSWRSRRNAPLRRKRPRRRRSRSSSGRRWRWRRRMRTWQRLSRLGARRSRNSRRHAPWRLFTRPRARCAAASPTIFGFRPRRCTSTLTPRPRR